MISLEVIIHSLEKFKVSNEDLYKLIDLKDRLQLIENKKIKISDLIISPYYIQDNKRLELYEYELNLRVVQNIDFNKHLLELTGKQKIEDISQKIIEIQRKCYIEVFNPIIDAEVVDKYIDYLFYNKDIKDQVQLSFGSYSIEKLFFEIY